MITLKRVISLTAVLSISLIVSSCRGGIIAPMPPASLPIPSLGVTKLEADIESLQSDHLFEVSGNLAMSGISPDSVLIEIKIIDNRGEEIIIGTQPDEDGNFKTNIMKYSGGEVIVIAKDRRTLEIISNDVRLDYRINNIALHKVGDKVEYEVLIEIVNTGTGGYSSYVECDAFLDGESKAEWVGIFNFSLKPGESTTGVCRDKNGNNLAPQNTTGNYIIIAVSEPGSFNEDQEYQPSGISPDILDQPDEYTVGEDVVGITSLLPNESPRLLAIGSFTVADGSGVAFTVEGFDPNGDELTFRADNLPRGASFDEVTNIFQWVPECDQIGEYEVRFEATDGSLTAVEAAHITVNSSIDRRVRICKQGLLVAGKPFLMKGIGYHPVPIGHSGDFPPYGDYFYHETYSGVYERDLPLIRDMGANTIRLWGWYPTYDHADFLDQAYNNGDRPLYVVAGYWVGHQIDFAGEIEKYENGDPGVISSFVNMVRNHKDHPAILMWSIGSEVNEDAIDPDGWYTLLNYMARVAHEEEGNDFHPVTTSNYEITNIADCNDRMTELDVWGASVYRGQTFGGLFGDYSTMSSKPFWITAYGVDAWHTNDPDNPSDGLEDEVTQAEWDGLLWDEIAVHSDMAIGGSVMAYVDEWWKASGSSDAHDYGGFVEDQLKASQPDSYKNEEWWGIMGLTGDVAGLIDPIEPRHVYFTLKERWSLLN